MSLVHGNNPELPKTSGSRREPQSIKEAFDSAERVYPCNIERKSAEPAVLYDDRGRPQWCMSTATALFEGEPDWQGCLRKDLFACRTMICRPIPGSQEALLEADFAPRELVDEDYAQAIIWANQNGFRNPSKELVRDAMEVVARRNAYDPVSEWLLSLTWDGNPRLDSWLEKYLGVEATVYTCAVGRCWMISAVARVLKPGCQVDTCLVLEGAQGSGKSSALRILAGEAYFGDNIPDLASKDASVYLRGKWIVELAELNALNRSSVEQTKAFISRRDERYRPPYKRNEVVEPRRCVFAGTTNANDYLRDPSGNRRFWPVRVKQVNVDALRRDREQLWAEAIHAFRSAQPWWLDSELSACAAEEQAERSEDDTWLSSIDAYCEGREAVACKEILGEVFQFTPDRMARADSNRVAGLLRRLGYEREGNFTSGPFKGNARFVGT